MSSFTNITIARITFLKRVTKVSQIAKLAMLCALHKRELRLTILNPFTTGLC